MCMPSEDLYAGEVIFLCFTFSDNFMPVAVQRFQPLTRYDDDDDRPQRRLSSVDGEDREEW